MSSSSELESAKSSRAFSKRTLTFAILAFAIAAGTAFGLSAKRAVWEGWMIDRLLQVRAYTGAFKEAVDNQPVAVVGLDRAALASDRLASVPRVFMTPVFAEAGQALLDAGALGVGYDFVFAFSADAFVDPVTEASPLRGFDRPFLAYLYKNRGRVFVARTSSGVPHAAISAAGGTGGVRFAEVLPDSDGVVRLHTPHLPLQGSPHFIDGFLELLGVDASEPYMALPNQRLARALPYLSLVDVLELKDTEAGRKELETFAKGRVVLFGSTLANEDEHLYVDRFLPIGEAKDIVNGESGRPFVRYAAAGVYILADMIGAPSTGRTAVAPPDVVLTGLAVVFATAGAAAGLLLKLGWVPVAAGGLLAAGFGIALNGFNFGLLVAPGVAPVAGLVALIISAIGKAGLLQRRERSLVRLFGHYLSPQVIKHMAETEELPELGGDTRHVVVAFVDIAGFTKMSSELPDKDVVIVVNSCFDILGKVITRHGGYIDKYIGDAIMAVWNAPNRVEHPEIAAVLASREIIGSLQEIRQTTGQVELDLRVALNAGPVLVGDIGGPERRSFTVMGTTVNTASRIESVAKDQSVRLAMSQSVVDGLDERFELKRLWEGQLRGLSTKSAVYTLDEQDMFIRTSEDASNTGAKVVQLPT